jgi:hypothetical protein
VAPERSDLVLTSHILKFERWNVFFLVVKRYFKVKNEKNLSRFLAVAFSKSTHCLAWFYWRQISNKIRLLYQYGTHLIWHLLTAFKTTQIFLGCRKKFEISRKWTKSFKTEGRTLKNHI